MKVLKTLYAYWMKFALAVGWFNTRVLLFLFYFLILGPVGLVGRVFGKNFFEDHPKGSKSYWHLRTEPAFSKETCQRQF